VYTYQDINVTAIGNSITNSVIIDTSSGKTITKPFNTNGNIAVNIYTGGGFKIKKIDTRVNVSPSFSYYKFADIINGKTSFSHTTNAGLSLGLSKSKDKKYDLSLNNDFFYNWNTSAQYGSVNTYATNTINFSATVYYKKVWSLSSDYMFNYRQKTVQFNADVNNSLWNAKLQRTFKKDEFTAYILVRDILNQNIGVDRNFNGNTLSQTTNERIKRYGMIGFTWNFKNKAAAKK
jgi:hypothetical protein